MKQDFCISKGQQYKWVHVSQKMALLDRVKAGESIKKVAADLGIHYSNAKKIVRA